jgi:hypothetical protein
MSIVDSPIYLAEIWRESVREFGRDKGSRPAGELFPFQLAGIQLFSHASIDYSRWHGESLGLVIPCGWPVNEQCIRFPYSAQA